jgi:hypothetical protein
MLTIFGNLFINDEVKLQHLKDSFQSFENTSDNWLINIRGKYRHGATNFLKEKLGSMIVVFDLQDDSIGWSKNSLEMIKKAKYEYILTWNEDHINIADQGLINDIVAEMKENNADYMMYTWYRHQERYNGLPFKSKKNIEVANITKNDWKNIIGTSTGPYILTTVGIFKKNLYIKLLQEDTNTLLINSRSVLMAVCALCGKKKNRCFYYLNRILFGGKMPKFPKELPHNIEKEPHRTDYLPLILARPKQELFACIDDDNAYQGSSLIKRGLYSPDLNTHPNKL